MKNKKGFTLVELLAVIAILAILVIIALPNVLEMYNKAQKQLFLTEAKKVYSESEKKYLSNAISGTKTKIISSADSSKLDMTGKKLQYCVILNSSGKVSDMKVSNGKWIASLNGKTVEELTIDDLEDGNLDDYECAKANVSLGWKSVIGNDLYQDITKVGNDIYVLSKNAIYKFDSSGKKTEISLELCDMGSFSGNRVVCYNFTDPSFRTENGYYNYQKEYIYEYDLNGKKVNSVLAWSGTVKAEYVGRGFDFDRISKVNDLYFFFSGPKISGVYGTDGNRKYYFRWNYDTDDYGYYDENYKWIPISLTEEGKKLNEASDVGYIYDYFYRREFNKYMQKYKTQLEQMGVNYTYSDLLFSDDIDLPTQAMIAASYKNKYYIGYLDSENGTYMALVHDKNTGKDIDIKINGKLFFSVILGDNYFIVLDSDINTCNQKECKKTYMKKYDYSGTILEEGNIMSDDNSFMGTSVGYITNDGFTVIAGNRPDGETAYTTSLIHFNNSK